MQFFAESVCRDEVVLDLRLSTTKRLMASACLRRGGKARSSQRKLGASTIITTKAWRHEHLNVTLFNETEMEQEEPREEADLILHDDDVLHGDFPSRTRRTLRVSALRVRQASTETLSTSCFQARCRTEGAPASCR